MARGASNNYVQQHVVCRMAYVVCRMSLNVCMLKTLLASHCFQTSRSKASLRICKRSGMHFELMRAGSNRDGIEGIFIDNCRKSP